MSLLNLQTDVKPHLKIDQTSDDVVLQSKLDAAEAFVSDRTGGSGGLAASAFTERVAGYRRELSLTCSPVVSVTSVTGADGQALVVANLDVDTQDGLIAFSTFYDITFPMPWYSVVYQTGYATAAAVPEELKEAVRLMTQHFYETQRGGRRGNTGGDDAFESAYARAQRILADVTTLPGFSS